jgi:hypothetical protein
LAAFLAFFAGDFLAAFFFFAALGMCLYLFKWFECAVRTAAMRDATTYELHHKTVFEERDRPPINFLQSGRTRRVTDERANVACSR